MLKYAFVERTRPGPGCLVKYYSVFNSGIVDVLYLLWFLITWVMSSQTDSTDLQEKTNRIMIFILLGGIFSKRDRFDKYRCSFSEVLTFGIWIKKPWLIQHRKTQVGLLWLLSVSHNSSSRWVKEAMLTAFRQQVCSWAHRCCCLRHARVHFWLDSGGNNYCPSLSHRLLRVLQPLCIFINSVHQSASRFSDRESSFFCVLTSYM